MQNNKETKTNSEVTTPDKKLEHYILEAKHNVLQKNLAPSIWGTKGTSYNFSGVDYGTAYGGIYDKAAKRGDWSKFAVFSPEDIAYKAYKEQTTKDLIADAHMGFYKLVAAGFLDSVGSWDIGDMTNTTTNKGFDEAGNWFQRKAREFRKSAEKENTIYKNGDDMWNAPYWMSQIQNQGYSLGLFAELGLEQAALSFLGPSANVAGLASKARLIKNALQFTHGITSGIREGYLNARHTGEEVYQKMLGANYSEEEALAKAGEAASINFKVEVGPLMALNTMQNFMLFGSLKTAKTFARGNEIGAKLGFSDAAETVVEKALGLNKINNKHLITGLKYGLVIPGSESVEELIQGTASKYGEYKALLGTKLEHDFVPFDAGARDEAISGFMGGFMLGGTSKVLSKISSYAANKEFTKEYDTFMKNTMDSNSKIFNTIKRTQQKYEEAIQKYKKNPTPKAKEQMEVIGAKYNLLRHKANTETVLQALQFDYLKGEGTNGYDMYVTNMQNQLNAVESGDTSTLEEFGLIKDGKEVFSGSLAMIKNTFAENIKDANLLKTLLEKNLNNVTSDFKIASDITRKEYQLESSTTDIQNMEKELQDLKSKDTGYQSLDNKGEVDALIKYYALKATSSRTSAQEAELTKLQKEVENFSSTDIERFLSNAADFVSLQALQNHIKSNKESLVKEISKLKTKKYIDKALKDRKQKKKAEIKKAKTKVEIEKIEEDLGENIDDDTKKALTKKKKSVALADSASKSGSKTTSPAPKKKLVREKSEEEVKEGATLDDSIDIPGFEGMTFGDLIGATEDDYDTYASRSVSNEASATDKGKEAMQNYLNYLEAKLKRVPDFSDLIEDRIKKKGYDSAEGRFNGYAFLYQSVRGDLTSPEDVYNQFFNPENAFEKEVDSILNYTSDDKKVKENNDKAEKEVKNVTEAKKQYTPEGVPTEVFYSNDGRTTSGDLKFAYNFQDTFIDEDGNRYIKRNLKSTDGQIVSKYYLLDSDFMLKVREESRNNPESLVIRQLDADDTIINNDGLTWGEAKAEAKKKFGDSSSKYKTWFTQRVPVGAIYQGEMSKKPVVLSLIHVNSWYTDKNVNDLSGDEISKGVEEVTKLREELAEKGTIPIILKNNAENSFGSLHKIPKDAEPITISESTGDTILGRVSSTEGGQTDILLTKSGNKEYFSGILLNKPRVNAIVHINKVGVNSQGEPLYIAFETMDDSPIAPQDNLRNSVNEKIFNSIKYAVLTSTLLNNKDNAELVDEIKDRYKFTISDAISIQKKIKEETGLDITKKLGNYANLFVRSFYSGGLTSVLKDDAKASGLTYLNTNKDGSIEFVFKGGNLEKKTIGNKFKNSKNILESLEVLLNDENGVLHSTKVNVNMEALNNTFYKSLTLIDKDGKLEKESKSYDNHLKDILKTNIVSHEIETINGEKIWVTDIQPMFYFETADSVQKTESPENKSDIEKLEPKEEVKQETDLEKRIRDIENNDTLSREDKDIVIAMIKNSDNNSTYSSRIVMSEEQKKNLENFESNRISGLTFNQQKELVGSLKHLIVSDLDFTKSGLQYTDIKKAIQNSISNHIIPQLEKSRNLLSIFQNIEGSERTVQDIQSVINKLESIVDQQEKLIGESGELIKQFTELLAVDISEEIVEDIQDVIHSKSPLEKDIKLGFSGILKLTLFGYADKALGTDTASRNLFGFQNYHSPNKVLNKLLDITTSMPSSWSVFNSKLEDMYGKTDNKLYLDLQEKFNTLSEDQKNKFLYKSVSKRATILKLLKKSPKFITLVDKKTGQKTIKEIDYRFGVIDENSTKGHISLKKQLESNFLSSEFVQTNNEGNLILDKDYTKNVLSELKEVIDNRDTNLVIIKDILSKLGFGLFNTNTIEHLIKQQGTKNTDGSTRDIFGNLGILGLSYKVLSRLANRSGEVIAEGEGNFLNDINTPLKNLINIETMLNKSFVSNSINVAGKMMQAAIANTSIHDRNQELIQNPNLIDDYLSIPYTENNYVLQLLKQDARFKESFGEIGFSSPDAFKVSGSNQNPLDFDKLPEKDILTTILGLYMNTKGATLSSKEPFELHKSLSFRLGQMPIQTISDKGRMLYLRIPLLDLSDGQIFFRKDGEASFDDSVLNFLVEQVFTSELKRILQSYERDTKFLNYNKSSKVFHLLPSFNHIEIEVEGQILNIHDVLQNYSEVFLEELKNQAKVKITDYINSELNKKISIDGKSGKLVELGFYNPNEDIGYEINNISSEYIKNKPGNTNLDRLRFSMSEFIINNLLNSVNTQQLYIGDLAFYSKDSLIPVDEDGNIDTEEIGKPEVYGRIAKGVSAILQKRMASLIAPGLELADSKNPLSGYAQNFIHLAINDVVSMSSSMKELIENQYGAFNKETNEAWESMQTLKAKITELQNEKKEDNRIKIDVAKNLIKEIQEKYFSEISDYFNITGTDAQEYTTWRAHLDMLIRQGSITRNQYSLFEDKILNGETLNDKELDFLLQPVKPVYTGLVHDTNSNVMRPTYIKSSAFPLIPQLTRNLKIDSIRRNLEALEANHSATVIKNKDIQETLDKKEIKNIAFEENGSWKYLTLKDGEHIRTKNIAKPVRASYQTANKIGSLNTDLSVEDFYNSDFEALESSGKLDSALSILPMSNFKIQQDTPSKEMKSFAKGKDSQITMGSQFFKILFGNFINNIDSSIFDSENFDAEIFRIADADYSKKVSGKVLYNMYNNIYSKYSDALKQQLEDELSFTSETFEQASLKEQNSIIKNLQNILEREITERDYPEYLKDSVKIIEESSRLLLDSTLMFDNNRYKFESLLQSIISNRLITHSLPGNSHISASSEGFLKADTLENLDSESKEGIIWVNSLQKDLKATFVETKDGKRAISKSQVLVQSHFRYTDENGEYKFVDLTSDKYSEDIVENGKVVGRKLIEGAIDKELLSNFSFRIPTSSHQSGAILEIVGFLPPKSGDLLIVPKEHTVQLGEDYDVDKRNIYKSNYLINKETGKIGKFKGDSSVEYSQYSLEKQIKLYENAFIDIYKSIYSTTNSSVQQKIFKPLNTDIAGNTADLIVGLLEYGEDLTNFSALSDEYQRYLLKMGSDGKDGIGVHSNAVVLEAQFQRLPDDRKVHLGKTVIDENGRSIYKPFTVTIGDLLFTDSLGVNSKTLDGNRDIADQHGENQNVSTDNINKLIMGKRNENKYTISIYALMAHMGFDLSADIVNTGLQDEKGNVITSKLHIPSLFLSQPILKDYVRLKQNFESATEKYEKDSEGIILEQLSRIYDFDVDNMSQIGNNENLTGQALWDSLREDVAKKNVDNQVAVLKTFLSLKDKAEEISEVQQLINLSTSKLGVSYFDVLQRISTLDKLADAQLKAEQYQIQANNYTHLIGEISEMPNEGYVKLGKYYWKPTTVEGKMFINSLSTASKIMPVFFPYEANTIQDILQNIFNNKGVDLNAKSKANTKWKYEIMTEFVNFVNSNIGAFEGEINKERNRLFFDDDSNGFLSLASILKSLRDMEHPIMKNPLLESFTYNKSLATGVHEILHTADEQTSVDKSNKYNAFLELLRDDSIIRDSNTGEPILFNGQITKVSDIAQDLVSYAYLSDDSGGAITFKNYIPNSYLSLIGISKNYRSIFNDIKADRINQETTESFIRQYFQHNPERALIMTEEEMTEILEDVESEKPKYVSVRNNDKSADLKRWNLFEFDGNTNTYKEVSILGTEGVFKEYSSEDSFQKSQVNDSKLNEEAGVITFKGNRYVKINEKKYLAVGKYESIFTSGKYDTVESLLKLIYENEYTSPEYKKLIEELQDFVNTDVNIEWNPNIPTMGRYNAETNSIVLNPKIYEKILDRNGNDWDAARQEFREVILEEILHSMTVREMDKYLEYSNKETGDFKLVSDAPVFMFKIAKAYEAARKALPYDESTPESTYRTYYSKNIQEFVAGMFIAKDYRQELEKKESGFVENFLEAIRDLLKNLYEKATGVYPDYKSEIFSAVKDLLKTNVEDKALGNKGVKISSVSQQIEEMKNEVKDVQEEVKRPLSKRSFNGIEYIVNNNLKSLALSGKDGTIQIRTIKNESEFWDYLLGKDDTQTSKQKQKVFEILSKEGIKIKDVKKLLDTKSKIYQFLILHEKSHIDNMDYKNYWKNGDNLMTSDKIDIEVRATKDALVEMGMNIEKVTPLKETKEKDFESMEVKIEPNNQFDSRVKADVDNNEASYQIPSNREEEEFIASEKTIRDLAARMASRIGLKVKYESDRTKNYKGKLEGDTAVINLAYATLDTPIHEILGHPIIRAIKNRDNILSYEEWVEENTFDTLGFESDLSREAYGKYVNLRNNTHKLYQNLLKELETGKGKEVFDRVKSDYIYKNVDFNLNDTDFTDFGVNSLKDLIGAKVTSDNLFGDKRYFIRINDTYTRLFTFLDESIFTKDEFIITEEDLKYRYTLEDQQEEAIVELLGLYTAGRIKDIPENKKLISYLKQLLKKMKAFIRSLLNQREVEVAKLPDSMTLGDIADLLAYSNSKLILPGYEVIYNTPDNKTFKTYQEASNYISELIKNTEDIDLDNIKINTDLTEEDKLNIQNMQLEIDKLRHKLNSDVYLKNKEKEIYRLTKKLNEVENATNVLTTQEPSLEKEDKDKYGFQDFDYVRIESTYSRPEIYDTTTSGYMYYNFHRDILGEDYEGYYIHGYNTKKGANIPVKKILPVTKEQAIEIYDNNKNTFEKYTEKDRQNILNLRNKIEELKNDSEVRYEIKSIQRKINEIESAELTSGGFIRKNKEYEQAKEVIEEWKKVNDIKYDPEEVYSRGQGFYSAIAAYSEFDVNLMLQNLLTHIEDNKKSGGQFVVSAYTKPVDKKINHIEGSNIRFRIFPKSEDIKWAANTDVHSGSVWDASEKFSKNMKSELVGVSYTKAPYVENISTIQPNLASIIDNLTHVHNELGIELTGGNFKLEYDDEIPYSTKKLIDSINIILDEKFGKIIEPHVVSSVTPLGRHQDLVNKSLYDELTTTEEKELESLDKKHGWNKQPTQTKENLKESIESIREKYLEDEDEKEYTKQALINTKVAALKSVPKKYQRSLIRSEVKQVSSNISISNNETIYQKVTDITQKDINELPPLDCE